MFKESEKRRAQKRRAQKVWLRKHPEIRNRLRISNYRRGAKNRGNFRSNWTIAEHDLITDHNRPCDRDLAEQLGRTVQAIQAERCRFKKAMSI